MKVKSICSSVLNDDLASLISIAAGSDWGWRELSWGPGPLGDRVIFPTPTQRLVPRGMALPLGGRVQPPLYQSLLPSCSLSSRLHDGAPPELALWLTLVVL